MAMSSIHYEVFVRRGKAGGWSLHGAWPKRDVAIAEAKAQLAENGAVGARVFKETFKAETGDFMTLKVFEEGEVADVKKKKDEGSSLPCFKPDDFYSFHGRRTIARLLREALGRWRITATELLHHTGHIERLELTGTVMQHAVQKAAVKHAGATGEPVQQVVKQLNELISRAISRVVMDERAGRLPRITPETPFAALCVRYAEIAGAEYYLNAAIAWHVEEAASWGEKLDRAVMLLGDLPAQEGPARAIGLSVVDALIADMLEGGAALGDLLGEMADLGTALLKLADLFLGRLSPAEGDPPGVIALAGEFAKGNLLNARAAIAHRVLSEIKGVRRLVPDSLDEEVRVMRVLAMRMAMGQGALASQEEILDAFTARCKHLVMSGTIDRYLEGAHRPEDKIEKLYTLEENVIGTANKRELSTFILGILGSPRTDAYFVESAEAPAPRLQSLSQIAKRNQRSGLQDLEKRMIADKIDMLALRVEQKAAMLDGIIRASGSPLLAVERLLSLIVNGILPEGALCVAARERARELMKRPAFKTAAQGAEPARVEALGQLIAKAGLEPANGKAADAA
jgi:hypothetical protein